MIAPLPDAMIAPLVEAALAEDLGRAGDVTSQACVSADARLRAVFVARKSGVIAGLACARLAIAELDPSADFKAVVEDGAQVGSGEKLAWVDANARALLSAERVGLNLMGRLSGVATLTRAYVTAVDGTGAIIVDTRKTTPGLRALEKYAVRCGGGLNHRFGLDDAVLVKDNHIGAAGGIEAVVKALRGRLGPMVKIEIEVDTLEQLETALGLGVDAILLDNMRPEVMKRAVALTRGRATLEASGGVTLEHVRGIAESGVDYISSGAITHSARCLDLGLDFL